MAREGFEPSLPISYLEYPWDLIFNRLPIPAPGHNKKSEENWYAEHDIFIDIELSLPFLYSPEITEKTGFEPVIIEVWHNLTIRLAEGLGFEPRNNHLVCARTIILCVYQFRHPSKGLYYIPL